MMKKLEDNRIHS